MDRLENTSRTVKGAQIIGEDNEALAHVLLPLKRWSRGSPSPSRYSVACLNSLVILLPHAPIKKYP